MNILIFSTDYKPNTGGIAEYTYQVAKHFQKKGHYVVVLSIKMPGSKEFDRKQSFKTVRVANSFLLSCWRLTYALISIAKQYKIEYVFSTITHPCGEITYLLGKFLKYKAVVAVHGYEVMYPGKTFRQRIKLIFKPLRTYIYNNVDAIFTVSNFSRKKLMKSGVRPWQISVFNNGVDISKWENRDLEKEAQLRRTLNLGSRKVILSISTLGERKGHDIVLKALPQVIKEVPHLAYLIGGVGPKRSCLENIVNSLKLQPYVRFLGFVAEEDISSLYHLSDVFVLISRQSGTSVEGFGIVFLEANACRKPVIGGHSGGISDAVIDGKTGLLVDPESPPQIARALIRLLKDARLAKKLGNQGYKRVRNELTWEKIVPKMLSKFGIY